MLSLQLPAPIPTNGREPAIDELKGMAILMVMLYHACGILGWVELQNHIHGESGVDIFLILSAFCLAIGSRSVSTVGFIRHRFLRIFPAYWLALALFITLRITVLKLDISLSSITLHALGLHGFASPAFFSDINDSFWFISLILALYGMFLGVRDKLEDLSFLIGVCGVTTSILGFIYMQFNHGGGAAQLTTRIPSFFIGLVAGQLASGGKITLRFDGWLAVGLCSMAFLGWARGIVAYVYGFVAVGWIALFLFIRPSLLKFADGQKLLKCLSWFGLISYEIYLFHQPFMHGLNEFFWRSITKGNYTITHIQIGVCSALLLTLAIAWPVHKLTALIFRRPFKPS